MSISEDRIPVIVGVGDIIDRPNETEDGQETLQLIKAALERANADAGGELLQEIETIDIVNVISWPYADIAGALTSLLDIQPKRVTHGPIGGESPLRYINDAALAIAQGDIQVAAVCGGEAQRSAMKALKNKKVPASWTAPDPNYKPLKAEDFVSRLAVTYGLTSPAEVYPLYENSLYTYWGQTYAEAMEESAVIWSEMSRIAAGNEYAWLQRPVAPDEIQASGNGNRMIAFPYPKLMVANNSVNIGSALLITSLAKAKSAGIDPKKYIYIGAGVAANEPKDFLQRDNYHHSPSMEAVLQKVLEFNGVTVDDIDFAELYSCFPCVPKMARRILNWPHEKPVTVIGGLTFAGAALNNYMTQSATGMVRKLRAEGKTGLLFGNGEFVTKNHALIFRNEPFTDDVFNRNYHVQEYADSLRSTVPELLEEYEGDAVLETYTVVYGRDGKPAYATVVGRSEDGTQRFVANVPLWNTAALEKLLHPEDGLVGTKGIVVREDEKNQWHFDKASIGQNPETKSTLLSGENDLIRLEKIGRHIALVTLNRPEKRNAVTAEMSNLMYDYIQRIERDTDIRAVVLASSNEKVFCAGADLSEVAKGNAEGIAHPIGGFLGYVSAKRTKPWIAAVNGFALGGGLEISLASDMIVCGENTIFGLPEVKRGIFAAAGGVFRLPKAIPEKVAMEMITTGDPIDAKRAYELGLVNKIVAAEKVKDEALKLAFKIAENAPLSVLYSLEIAKKAYELPEEELWQLNLEKAKQVMATKDVREGSSAFVEKRKPEWKGY